MPKLTYKCPVCNKDLKLKDEIQLGTEKLYSYTCGHSFAKPIHSVSENLDFTSLDGSGHRARHYQEDGVRFILESDFNCIIADQMRLGKTPTALLALKNAMKERTPALIVVKGANLWQWVREFRKWVTVLPNGIYPIVGTGAWIPPGFSTYIISMDTFSRPKMLEKLKTIPFKLVICDEAHSFKNTDSNRSQALTDFIKFLNTGEESRELTFKCARCQNSWTEIGKQKFDKRIGHVVISKSSRCPTCGNYCYVQQQHNEKDKWTENPEAVAKVEKLLALAAPTSGTTEPERLLAKEKAEQIKQEYNIKTEEQKPVGIVLLTGTPILNRAEEYFVPLNLVNPERFNSLEGFRRSWLEQDHKGRWSRVKRYYQDEFKRIIKPHILRREKEDVFTDLPALNVIYTLIEPDLSTIPQLKERYNSILDSMEVDMAEKPNISFWDMSDKLMELRRLCALAKLPWTSDYLEACAMESNTKYAIGIHHESVRDMLYMRLGDEKNCYKLSGETSSDQKDWIMRNWESSDKQFLIINMLAGGVGMDFHYCDNVVVLERQWNKETERQFEFRFYNPDKSINKNSTTVEYVLAKGTLDEWWHDMEIEKSKNVDPLVYNNQNMIDATGSFRELCERTVAGRL